MRVHLRRLAKIVLPLFLIMAIVAPQARLSAATEWGYSVVTVPDSSDSEEHHQLGAAVGAFARSLAIWWAEDRAVQYLEDALSAAYNMTSSQLYSWWNSATSQLVGLQGSISQALFYQTYGNGSSENPYRSSVIADYTNWDPSPYYTGVEGGWCEDSSQCLNGFQCWIGAGGIGYCHDNGGGGTPPM